jgi:pimeloyl-ACP methyl ester carboxylesterase
MAEVSHHTAEIDGEPVSWRSAPGRGTPTLYVHGVPNSSLMWQPFLERSGGEAIDLPGFGDVVKAATFPSRSPATTASRAVP